MDRLRRLALGEAAAVRLRLPSPPRPPPRLFESHRLPDTNAPLRGDTKRPSAYTKQRLEVLTQSSVQRGSAPAALFVLKWCGTILFVQTAKRSFSCPAAGGVSCPAGRENPKGWCGVTFPSASLLAGAERGFAPIAARRFTASPAFVVARSAYPLCDLCVLCGFALKPSLVGKNLLAHGANIWQNLRQLENLP